MGDICTQIDSQMCCLSVRPPTGELHWVRHHKIERLFPTEAERVSSAISAIHRHPHPTTGPSSTPAHDNFRWGRAPVPAAGAPAWGGSFPLCWLSELTSWLGVQSEMTVWVVLGQGLSLPGHGDKSMRSWRPSAFHWLDPSQGLGPTPRCQYRWLTAVWGDHFSPLLH